MSVVTNIILITEPYSEDKIELLNAYIRQFDLPELRKVDSLAGGDKCMECDVFCVAYNHFNYEGLIDVFDNIEWGSSRNLLIVIPDLCEERPIIIHTGKESNAL